ncbi:MAG: protein kinase [Rubrivivax sp.]
MPLGAADLSTLSRLLDEAIDLDAAGVEPWLAALPAEHAHLLPLLRQMLLERTGSAGFMAGKPRLDEPDESVARVGDRIGPYRLIREIGRGGMGSVWLAERADGSLKRHVALKLPRLAWGAGLAERMAREREIGALLEHPNIARLYDAGVDLRDRPYLALEFIEGRPIDAWCEERALSPRERLRLIVQVARAVSYAHGRLVVHRDLKPSNILVTADGQTHLLDFGIAKLLHEAAGEPGLTQEQGRVLTPHFASPEQLRGETITVQSDVYSLGVLLYELLTGSMPYTPRRNTLGALEEAVLEGEPALASSRAGDKATAGALRGEVDTILAQALKREPAQRYATADAFANDIERHLAGERVLAQPDTAWYRLRKSAQRHRVGFAAAAAVLVAVLLGSGVSVVQARRANQEAERARIVKDFVVDIFKVNSRDDPAKNELRQLPAELLLERGARLIDTKFAGQPRLQAELYGVVGEVFADMASAKLAAQYATRQVEALTAVNATPAELARSMLLLARALGDQGRLADAETRARRAVDLAREDADLQVRARLVLAKILFDQAAYDELGRTLDAVDRSLATERGSPSPALADATALRGKLLRAQGQGSAAESMFEKAIQIALASEGPLSRRAVDTRLTLLYSLMGHSRSAEARAQADAALATMRALGGADDVGAALAQSHSAGLLFDTGDMPASQALAMATAAQETLARRGPGVPEGVRARVEHDLGWIHLRHGNTERAAELLLPAIPVLRASTESPFERRALATLLGLVKSDLGRHDEADALMREGLEMRKIDSAANPPGIALGHVFIAENLAKQGRSSEAESVLAAAPDPAGGGKTASARFAGNMIAIWRAEIALQRGDAAPARAALAQAGGDLADGDAVYSLKARALCVGGDAANGWPLMEEQLRDAATERYEYSPQVAHWRALTGLCALDLGRRQRAAELAELAREAFAQRPNVSPYFKAPLLELDRRLARR